MARPKHTFYWDASIFIAWLTDEQRADRTEMDAIAEVIQRNQRGEVLIVAGPVMDQELVFSTMTIEAKERFHNALRTRRVQKLPYDPRADAIATEIREYYAALGEKLVETADSLHLGYAIHYQVDQFHTFDDGGRKGRSLLALDGNVAGYRLKICKPPLTQLVLPLSGAQP